MKILSEPLTSVITGSYRLLVLLVLRIYYEQSDFCQSNFNYLRKEVHVKFKKRTDPSLDRYLQEIGEITLLKPEEEIALARRIKRGDHEALEKLTKANLRFVVSIALKYQNRGLSLGDLINEGNLGLITAAKRFDESRGFKFISYAVWWIRQSILQAISEQSRVVRLPLNRISDLNKVGKAMGNLEQELERRPSTNEIAKETEMTPDEVSDTIQISMTHSSLDAPLNQGTENKLLDIIKDEHQPTPDNGLLDDSLRIQIQGVLSTLTDREAKILKLSFGLEGPPLTLEVIGEKFNITRERVRQIKEKGLRKLRHPSRSLKLQSYLD